MPLIYAKKFNKGLSVLEHTGVNRSRLDFIGFGSGYLDRLGYDVCAKISIICQLRAQA